MSVMRMFAIKDSKMNLFMNPMFFTSKGQAIRVVQDEVNRAIQGQEPPTTLQAHPEDVALYELGEFDSEFGVVTGNKVPVLVVECKELVNGRA